MLKARWRTYARVYVHACISICACTCVCICLFVHVCMFEWACVSLCIYQHFTHLAVEGPVYGNIHMWVCCNDGAAWAEGSSSNLSCFCEGMAVQEMSLVLSLLRVAEISGI